MNNNKNLRRILKLKQLNIASYLRKVAAVYSFIMYDVSRPIPGFE
jgi:hypothetical protein